MRSKVREGLTLKIYNKNITQQADPIFWRGINTGRFQLLYKFMFGLKHLYKKLHIGFLLLTLLSFCQTAYSIDRKKFKIDYLNIYSGLSNNYVSKVLTDKNGLKWFATSNGLNRFDGVGFKYLMPSKRYQQLLNENILALSIDKEGDIWVGTQSGGLSKYDVKKDTFTNYNKELIGKTDAYLNIRSICEDKLGRIWVGSSQGVFVLDQQENLVLSFNDLNNVRHIINDLEGNIWLGSGDEIHKYILSENRVISIDAGHLGWIMKLYYDKSRNKLLIGTGNGAYEFSTDNQSFKKITANNKEIIGVNSINVDHTGRIWLGSWQEGLYVSNPTRTSFEKFSLLPLYQSNKNYEVITDIHIDSNQQIWIGTGFAGVVKLIPQRNFKNLFNTPKQNIGLPDNNIQDIHKDTNGHLWCATRGNGIGYSKNGKIFTTLPNTESMVTSCVAEVKDMILVGHAKGLSIYDKQKPFEKPLQLGNNNLKKVKVLYYDTKGKLWIGTKEDGLASIHISDLKDENASNKFFFHIYASDSSKLKMNSLRVSAIDEDAEGNIWIGTYGGLYKYDYKTQQFVSYTEQLKHISSNLIVHSLYAKEKNKVWLGFPGGLMELKHNGTTLDLQKLYTKEEGLDHSFITSITKDGQNNLWLGHSKGLSYLPANTSNIYNYGIEEGVEVAPINRGAIYNDNNQVYFGGENGIVTFAPQFINISTSQPEVNFTNLTIDNQTIQVGDTVNGRVMLTNTPTYTSRINLTHKEKVSAFSFVTNDHLGNKNIQYYYRLVGLSDEWINNGKRNEVSFRNLPAGDYTLEVKVSRDNIHFGATKALHLSVAPPPWASTWAYITYVILFILVVYIVLRNVIKQTKLRANIAMAEREKQKEHELAEDKLRFFTNISHELRTPLTLILSPLSEVLHEQEINNEVRKKLSYAETNANRLLTLINQLLDFRKAETGNLNVRVSTNNFVEFAEKSFESFKGHAESLGVTYDFNTEEDNIPLTFDKDKIETVLSNLLINAFKYTPKKGSVNFSLSQKDGFCYISIKDSGKGIPEKYHQKIFNRFFQIKENQSANMAGSGIGLSLSKKIIELHHGTIEIQNNKGAEFIIKLPLGTQHFNETQFQEVNKVDDIATPEIVQSKAVAKTPEEQSELSLLIVDDNDDIRNYLKELFEKYYTVYVAENGKEGLELARTQSPDLIISDVMMPEMDGIEFSSKVKSDIKTSHIPVILLTAKTSTQHELEGLNTGADDYIKKPFDSRVIISRVENLLNNRKKIQDHFTNKVRFEPEILPEEKQAQGSEEAFIAQAIKLVEDNIDNVDLNVEFLANEFCMSQSTLYRKIKALTGLSSVNFIRSIRLKKAAELILNENLKFSAVAFMVGFSDYSYFKRAFAKEYGMNPTAYKASKKEK